MCSFNLQVLTMNGVKSWAVILVKSHPLRPTLARIGVQNLLFEDVCCEEGLYCFSR